ncbi:MAG: OmpA family protein [Bacteroidia bacterium]|nr:OmpA family protein [Bacteroidia bacterium]
MKKAILSVLLAGSFLISKSQDYLGYSSSNYSGITGVQVNPANVVESRMKFDMNLIGINFAAGNNYIGVKRSAFAHSGKLKDGMNDGQDLSKKGAYFPAFSDPQFNGRYLTEVTNGKDKAVFLKLRIDGPSFLINLNRKNAIGFSSASRTYFNVDGVSEDLARLIYYDVGRNGSTKAFDPNNSSVAFIQNLLGKEFNVEHLSINTQSWLEYGLTYGHVFRDKDEHYFKAGVTAKYLQGLASAYFNIKDLTYKFNNDTIMGIFHTDINYGHSENLELSGLEGDYKKNNPVVDDPTLNSTFGGGYPKAASLPGWGFDLGVVYEFRPKYKDFQYDMDGETGLWRKDKNKYKLKVGASLTDLGYIKYGKGKYSNNVTMDLDSIRFRELLDNENYDVVNGDTIKWTDYQVYNFDRVLDSLTTYNNEAGSYKMYLPTQLSFQVDYNIWKDFYVNLTPTFAFKFKNKEAKVHEWTNISLTPRWDHRWFGVAVPISYNTFYAKSNQPISIGASVRIGPLILGTNRLATYVSTKKDVFGADFYMMLKVPIPYHGPRDRDKDKVSDKKDKCKTVPGVWEFMGCPDRDGDHIQDAEDKCPDTPGLKELQGCPDRDGDGITDAEDACPDDKGLLEFKGCPDRDGDKIIDKDDECPDDAGLPDFMGCPDKDGDGTPDKLDACVDIPGPKEYKGCPDRDGDTVLDKEDECPDVAGPVENKGCPWPDTDKDGLIDKDDKCPTIPGVKDYQGCPPPPPIKAAELKIIERAFKSLEFATGKDIIVAKSLPSLNELAKLLKQHDKDWTLKLSGHTDNQGNAEKNMDLSEKRSNAVKRYLVKKGVTATNVITEWFGQTVPIESNDTPAGRQKNRRVEMKILFKEPAK